MTDVCTCLDVFGEDPNCKLHGGPLRLAVFETFGARCDQFDPECETCQAWAEIDRLQHVKRPAVTAEMADAMLAFVHSKKASLLTNTELFRQGIEVALATGEQQ